MFNTIGMQGPTIKTYFAKKMGIDLKNIVNVCVTLCTAQRFEIRRNEMNSAGKYLGIDSLTFSFHYVKMHRSSYFFILVFHFITMC